MKLAGNSNVALAACLLLALGLHGCKKSAPTNPLFGTWHLTGGNSFPTHPGFKCTITDLTFSETTETAVENGTTNPPLAVNYVYGGEDPPKTVFVMTNAGIDYHVTYNFHGRDDIVRDDALSCAYHRVS